MEESKVHRSETDERRVCVGHAGLTGTQRKNSFYSLSYSLILLCNIISLAFPNPVLLNLPVIPGTCPPKTRKWPKWVSRGWEKAQSSEIPAWTFCPSLGVDISFFFSGISSRFMMNKENECWVEKAELACRATVSRGGKCLVWWELSSKPRGRCWV